MEENEIFQYAEVIKQVLQDVPNPVEKINISTDEKEQIKESGSFITNQKYNPDSGIDLSALSNDQINEIALRYYTENQSGSNLTSSGLSIDDVLSGNSKSNNIGTKNNSSLASSDNTTTNSYDNIESNTGSVASNDTYGSGNRVLDAIVNGTNAAGDWVDNNIASKLDNVLGTANNISNSFSSLLTSISEYLGDSAAGTLKNTFAGILSTIANGLVDYVDGITETSFGSRMEGSWYGSSSTAFLNYFKEKNASVSAESRQINILSSTPLDAGETRNSLYGSLMLGAPFLFNSHSDPTNRTLINSLIKDGKFVSFTPGLPKFNGLSYNTAGSNILNQTSTPTSMLHYLTKNGLDRDFADKDKRYYTFKTDYKDYFAYLETMLNIVWIKMGLAKDGQTFNLFSFFNIKDSSMSGGINPSEYDTLKERYNSSIGFFTNAANSVSESVSNSTGGYGSDLANQANSNSLEYQRINYITGMGTGNNFQKAARKIGIVSRSLSQTKDLISNNFGGTISAFREVFNTSRFS